MSRYSRLSIPKVDLPIEAADLCFVMTQLARQFYSTENLNASPTVAKQNFENLEEFGSNQIGGQKISKAQLVAIYILIFQIKRLGPSKGLQNIVPIFRRDPDITLNKERGIVLLEKIIELSKNAKNVLPSADQIEQIEQIEQMIHLIVELAPLTISIFEEFQLSKIPGEVSLIMKEWLNSRLDLTVVDRVPSPQEVLTLQAQGQRMVSLFFESEKHSNFVLEKCDTYEFCLHDLSHAAKFFLSDQRAEQIAFFKQLDRWLTREQLLEKNISEELRQGLHYVMSDMNSHSDHLELTLRAHLKNFGVELDCFDLETISTT